MSNQVATIDLSGALPPVNAGENSIFSNLQRFQETQQMAEFLSGSDIVPQTFKGKPQNVLIALEMANRLKADPMMVMQNLYIVHGKPSWSSSFLISCVNSCGRFTALQFEYFGTEGQDDWGCFAYAKELNSGEVVEGPKVTMAMAKAEGWSTKNGSKWKTMPQLMLRYRAATFFVRTVAPEVSMGMRTEDELVDMGKAQVVGGERKKRGAIDQALLGLKKEPEVIDNEAPQIDYITFFKQSIDACPDLATLNECGGDIAASKGDMTEEQSLEVKRYYNEKLKAFKAAQ